MSTSVVFSCATRAARIRSSISHAHASRNRAQSARAVEPAFTSAAASSRSAAAASHSLARASRSRRTASRRCVSTRSSLSPRAIAARSCATASSCCPSLALNVRIVFWYTWLRLASSCSASRASPSSPPMRWCSPARWSLRSSSFSVWRAWYTSSLPICSFSTMVRLVVVSSCASVIAFMLALVSLMRCASSFFRRSFSVADLREIASRRSAWAVRCCSSSASFSDRLVSSASRRALNASSSCTSRS
mmetsp:Transcript_27971/g.70312  ORF Transcript_27971/g.70312 Transcript_27971/m.70312 type:complete len:247 (-) Transcript_27971:713-1453(-)